MLHPEVAYRSCEDCAKHQYDEETGEVVRRPRKHGPPMPRVGDPPCRTCPKIPPNAPVASPAASIELTERGWAAYRHYLKCKAVGRFPEDEAVETIAGAIAPVEQECAQLREERRMNRLTQALVMSQFKGKRG